MKKKLLASVLCAGMIAGVLTGCGSNNSNASASSAASAQEEGTTETGNETSGAEAEQEAKDDRVVNIGTMNLVNGDLIAQYEEYYENELGVEVNLVSFESGKDVNTALAAGSIDISELGSSPTAQGIANGVDYEVFWIGDVIGAAESLAVKNDSGISSIEDLAGKKVATPFASTSHYSLLNALSQAGISETDVELLDLQPADIYAAWTRGDIDAAYVWYPVLGQLLEDGTTITDSEKLAADGIITADLNVVRTEFAEENPDIVINYVKAQIKANDVLLNDPETAAKEVASVLEISEEDAAEQITQFKYLTAEEQIQYLNEQIAQTLKDTADFLVEQDSIKEAPAVEDFSAKVTTEFIEEAIK